MRKLWIVGRLRAGATALAMLLLVLGATPRFAPDYGITDERLTRRAETGGEATRAAMSAVAPRRSVAGVAALLRPRAPSLRLTRGPASPILSDGVLSPREQPAGDPALPRAPPRA